MKPFPNLDKMLNRYAKSDFDSVVSKLEEIIGRKPKDYEVFDEIARHNGELAGLGPNNTARERASLFSENPIISYHWTPGHAVYDKPSDYYPKAYEDFGDFTKLPYDRNRIKDPYMSEHIWDRLGAHSGTLDAAHERMSSVTGLNPSDIDQATDYLFNAPHDDLINIGSIRPLVIDGDKPFNYFGKVAPELDVEDAAGNVTKGLQDLLFRRKSRAMFGNNYDIDQAIDAPEDLQHTVNENFINHLRKRIFDRNDYTTIPYINGAEDAGSVSYITQFDRIKSPHARFDPRQFRSGNMLDAKIAAPASMFQLDPEKTKTDNETAREVADFATGFVPVLGSAREAARDFQKGNYGWGAFNSAMAAAEIGIPALAGVKLIRPAIAKGMRYFK